MRRLALASLIGLALAAALLAAGLLLARPAQAQDLGLAISKTLRGSELVQVGQILEFSIQITNTGTLPVVELDLVDEFVGAIVAPSGVGQYAKPGDPPLSDTQPYSYDGAETISWQLLGNGRQLGPGETLEVLVRLRAIRPSEQLLTVNRARIARAIRSDGGSSGGGSAEVPAQPRGARLPMTKTLGAPAPVRAGLPITFTITITNASAVDIRSLPLRDIYNPAALQFQSAQPPPLSADQARGVLEWDDLLTLTGRRVLRPGESISVVTVYTALRDISAAVNTAEVRGAKDEYNNDVAPAQAQAPIRVVGPGETPTPDPNGGGGGQPEATPTERPTATPTPFPTAGPRLTEIVDRLTATAQAAITATSTSAAPTATPSPSIPMPASLPNTGAAGDGQSGGAWLIALLLVAIGLSRLWRSRRQ